MTPLSPVLTVLYKSYQSVFSHSTIDVFDEWSSKALFGLAARKIMENNSANKLSKVDQLVSTFNFALHVLKNLGGAYVHNTYVRLIIFPFLTI